MTASEVKSLLHPGLGRLGSSQWVSTRLYLTSETDMGLKAKLLSHSYRHTSSLGKGSVSQSVGRFLEHFIILGSHNVCLNSGWPQAAFQTGTIHQDIQTSSASEEEWNSGRVRVAHHREANAGYEGAMHSQGKYLSRVLPDSQRRKPEEVEWGHWKALESQGQPWVQTPPPTTTY